MKNNLGSTRRWRVRFGCQPKFVACSGGRRLPKFLFAPARDRYNSRRMSRAEKLFDKLTSGRNDANFSFEDLHVREDALPADHFVRPSLPTKADYWSKDDENGFPDVTLQPFNALTTRSASSIQSFQSFRRVQIQSLGDRALAITHLCISSRRSSNRSWMPSAVKDRQYPDLLFMHDVIDAVELEPMHR